MELFQLKKWEMHTCRYFDDEITDPMVLLRIQVMKRVIEVSAQGVGPVDTLGNALRQALKEFYPAIEEITFRNYHVYTQESQKGKAAEVNVIIKLQRGEKIYLAKAASSNIIEASWNALVEGFTHLLFREESSTKEFHHPVLRKGGKVQWKTG